MIAATPEQIIEAFDHCLVYIYGSYYARDNPNKTDLETATKWSVSGLDLVTATIVFYGRMNWMHEKHLHQHDENDRSNIPGSLKLFEENIEAALRRTNGEGIVDLWECELSKWRVRCKGWLINPAFWRFEMWGPAPFENQCRVPISILKEIQPDLKGV